MNEKLSKERAQAVVNYLASIGNLSVDRMTAVGYDFTKPIVPNQTAEGRAHLACFAPPKATKVFLCSAEHDY